MRNKTYRLWGKSSIHGYGVFALRFIPKGAKIHCPRVGLDHGFNHSHDPNIANRGRWHWKALKDILPGTEITISYNHSPAFIAKTGCNCPVCANVCDS